MVNRIAQQVVAQQLAIIISILFQHPLNRVGGRTSIVRQITMLKECSIRNTALAVMLILAAVFYSLWCARSFYVAPVLEFPKGIPIEARTQIVKWQKSKGYFGPEPFGWDRFLVALRNPLTKRGNPISVHNVTQRLLVATHSSRPGMAVRFIRGERDWNSFNVQTGPMFSPEGPKLLKSERTRLEDFMTLPRVESTD
jgi:hypothetical protein